MQWSPEGVGCLREQRLLARLEKFSGLLLFDRSDAATRSHTDHIGPSLYVYGVDPPCIFGSATEGSLTR